ncbi:unnamed protein product [Prorocentrum cordatum]|uniref:Uncharacterized protein n=1 Tax=Prorocentrum cordatum TaxID=2364126 RepID=A0ABN9T1P3_9DINO|nr:unnamed protein product [Polarella glacialis]
MPREQKPAYEKDEQKPVISISSGVRDVSNQPAQATGVLHTPPACEPQLLTQAGGRQASDGRARPPSQADARKAAALQRREETRKRKGTRTKGETTAAHNARRERTGRGEDAAAGREPPDPAVRRARPRHACRGARRRKRREGEEGEGG